MQMSGNHVLLMIFSCYLLLIHHGLYEPNRCKNSQNVNILGTEMNRQVVQLQIASLLT